MNRAERRAAKRCKHNRTDIKLMTDRPKPATRNGEPTGKMIHVGYRVCLDCGAENKTPIVVPA